MRRQGLAFIGVVLLSSIFAFALPRVSSAKEQTLILGIHPYLSSSELYKRFSPLADHLSRELGRSVQIHIENSYDSHINAIGKGRTDIAFMGPASFVKLTAKYG